MSYIRDILNHCMKYSNGGGWVTLLGKLECWPVTKHIKKVDECERKGPNDVKLSCQKVWYGGDLFWKGQRHMLVIFEREGNVYTHGGEVWASGHLIKSWDDIKILNDTYGVKLVNGRFVRDTLIGHSVCMVSLRVTKREFNESDIYRALKKNTRYKKWGKWKGRWIRG